MSIILADYLLYYPTIVDGNTDPQVMNNTVTLPRYTDGKGVMMMAVTDLDGCDCAVIMMVITMQACV